jgi:hypothetical protein
VNLSRGTLSLFDVEQKLLPEVEKPILTSPFLNSLDENTKFLNNEIQLQNSAPMNQTISRSSVRPKK